jgi:iron complex outermembrane recepter protein
MSVVDRARRFFIRMVVTPLLFLTAIVPAMGFSQISGVVPIVDPLTEEAAPPVNQSKASGNLFDLDIENLAQVDVVKSFDVPVTSVSKQESTVGRSPAAVFVISSEMIHRSGATTIPDVLRLAPGVEVAQINTWSWAITIRGFNDRFTNKLLVMIDGRSVYNPVFGGVSWNMPDLILDDIDRIEVIRGPGGTLWGANAVNGVINIITKSANDTKGTYVSSGGGSHDYMINNVRHGGKLGKEATYRVWGRNFDRGPENSPTRYDGWRIGHGGFRVDWNPKSCGVNDLITIEGDYLGGSEGMESIVSLDQPPYVRKEKLNGNYSCNNILARWTREYDEQTNWSLQTYFDQSYYEDVGNKMSVDTFDIDFQNQFSHGRNNWIWGVEYRRYQDYLPSNGMGLIFNPVSRVYDTSSAFVQDQIELVEDRFYFTLGSKFEINTFTGFEYQPSVRAIWMIDNKNALWGAVSRAVRTPSRVDENSITQRTITTSPFPIQTLAYGSTNLVSEDMIGYEIGFRRQATDQFSWDLALFYNEYRNLMVHKVGTPYWDGPIYMVPSEVSNSFNAQTYGFEWTANWDVTKQWRLAGSYSFLKIWDTLDRTVPPFRPVLGAFTGDPTNRIKLQSYWQFAENWQLDAFLRYVDQSSEGLIPAYWSLDLRLGWRPKKNLELSVVGQNLLDFSHLEMSRDAQYFEPIVEIERAVFAKMTWTY